MPMKQAIKIISLIAIIFFVVADLIFLNWQILRQLEALRETREIVDKIAILPNLTPQTILESSSPTACSVSCLSKIYEATASLKLPTPIPQKTTPSSFIRESIITFGSGSTRAGDWEDITGLAVYIDNGKYGKIKSVVFEAAVLIPNGNQGVYVRLFNVTDGHPVWYSDVYHEGGTAKLLISPSLTLGSGNKLYQVQMKTTLKDLANLNQARIRITSE